MPFRDRREAGRRLAHRLARLREERPVVLGLPRGGVPVAHEVAAALGAPLDVIVVRKLGAPGQPELAVGAVGEGGERVLNPRLVAALGLTPEQLDRQAERETAEVKARVERFRGGRPPYPVAGRTVVVVDDGLATGATARAAAHVVQARGAARVVVAAPVASPDTVEALEAEVDEVVCLETPRHLMAIGEWYEDFSQVADREVAALLRPSVARRSVEIASEERLLPGELAVPPGAEGLVVFAHGSGSSRYSPRNVAVADDLNSVGLATLLFDLLTTKEGSDRAKVFDIPLLAGRLEAATRWASAQPELAELRIGYFGASTGAAAALWAAADLATEVGAIVARGGRPDLAGSRLNEVVAPTLLIVGSLDHQVLDLNRMAQAELGGPSELDVVTGASHLFEEPGALEAVAKLAASWFGRHLGPRESAQQQRE